MLGLSGCSQGAPPLLEIERLAFVPPGSCRVGGLVDCSTGEALVVDRYEVTNALWSAIAHATLDPSFAAVPSAAADDAGRHPATGMTLPEARAFATARGMRLPTVAEWMCIAAGTGAQPWPWGTLEQDSSANTADLGLLRPSPVGTFQNGQTFSGVHDMLGNVWEWVEGPVPTYFTWELGTAPREVRVLPRSALVGGLDSPCAWAMGGSYLEPTMRLFGWDARNRIYFAAQALEPLQRSNDLGLRCVAAAEPYLWSNAVEWSAPALRQRLVAVGASPSWSRRSVPMLEALARRPDAPASLRWLLEGARR